MSDLLITAEPDIVTRLRERIDEITCQRDEALADLHKVRLQRERWAKRARRRANDLHAVSARLTLVAAELERMRRELAGERAMRRRLQEQRTTTEPGSSPVVGALPGSGRTDSR